MPPRVYTPLDADADALPDHTEAEADAKKPVETCCCSARGRVGEVRRRRVTEAGVPISNGVGETRAAHATSARASRGITSLELWGSAPLVVVVPYLSRRRRFIPPPGQPSKWHRWPPR